MPMVFWGIVMRSLEMKRLVSVGNFFGIFWGLLLSGCGDVASVDAKHYLRVVMMGAFEAPEGASGNGEPKYQNYMLRDVSGTLEETGEVIDLYDDDPLEVRIVSRSQIIYEADISDYEGKIFSQFDVALADTVTGIGASGDELEVTLPSDVLSYAKSYTVPKAKSARLTIKVQWKGTIVTDEDADPAVETMTAPTFDLDLTDD
jgi:hypothetical protein